eukprot:3024246-Rhodomonas_salina.1
MLHHPHLVAPYPTSVPEISYRKRRTIGLLLPHHFSTRSPTVTTKTFQGLATISHQYQRPPTMKIVGQ